MTASSETLPVVRRAVRSIVENTPELRGHPDLGRKIAQRMVGVSLAAAQLIDEERRLTEMIVQRSRDTGLREPVATAQAASDIHGRTAVKSAPELLRSTRDAIDFPAFVTSLITGVFQAIQTSNLEQLQAFADLLEAIDSSTVGFATAHVGLPRAARWVAERFGVFVIERENEDLQLNLRDGAEMPAPELLKQALEATDDEVATIEEGDLGETLLPLVQRKLARDRQSMLATMVLMGLQRIVVDDGQLHASMRLQVDARSLAEQRRREQLDTRIETAASGSFGVGLWGASARMSASVGYVRSDDQFSREDVAVTAGLRSSVDLRFRSLPLDVTRMASGRTLQQLQQRSMAPERELELGSLLAQAPTTVTAAAPMPTPPGPGTLLGRDDGTAEEARRRREQAAQAEPNRQRGREGGTGTTETERAATARGRTDTSSAGSETRRSGTETSSVGSETHPGGTAASQAFGAPTVPASGCRRVDGGSCRSPPGTSNKFHRDEHSAFQQPRSEQGHYAQQIAGHS